MYENTIKKILVQCKKRSESSVWKLNEEMSQECKIKNQVFQDWSKRKKLTKKTKCSESPSACDNLVWGALVWTDQK